jgi:catechol 2,3-dioxygenase-like lactoylglutathione lyase family enzyme
VASWLCNGIGKAPLSTKVKSTATCLSSALLSSNLFSSYKMGIHHINITVADFDKAKAFYNAALAPLGYKEKMSFPDCDVLGMGSSFAPDFWIAGRSAPTVHGSDARHRREGPTAAEKAARAGVKREVTGPMHIAFSASNRQQVRDFHKAAMSVFRFLFSSYRKHTYVDPFQCRRRRVQRHTRNAPRLLHHLLRRVRYGPRGPQP